MAEQRGKKLGKRRLCGHCNEELSKTLYHKHKQKYYDEQNKRWCHEPIVYDFPCSTSSFTEDNSFQHGECQEDVRDEPEVSLPAETLERNDDECLGTMADVNDSSDDDLLYTSEDNYEELGGDELEFSEEECNEQLQTGPTAAATSTSSNCGSTEQRATNVHLFFILMFQSVFRISDTAINALLMLLKKFFHLLGKLFACEQIVQFSTELPNTVLKARRTLGNTRDNFNKYVCCPKCSAIYEAHDKPVVLECTNVAFPNHPQAHFRQPCGASLYKNVKTARGDIIHRPLLIYCYKSIIDSLQDMLSRPDFLSSCEEWRQRIVEPGLLRDVYDGEIWSEFQTVNGKPFLSLPYNFALQINIDWFQPFTHTTHSEGAIYLSIMNLPRSKRYLYENTLLAGVIPGPNEPKKTINSFLTPIVSDLLKLWTGVVLKHDGRFVLVRAALLCAGCDIPAARKTCGFLGHSARLGCSKCLLEFPTNAFGEKPDYSNFERSTWRSRTNEHHREAALKQKKAKTKTDQKQVESASGVRFSVLLDLPYFNAPRMCIIDPMHNLFLGTSKKLIALWKGDNDALPSGSFPLIQRKVDSFVTTGEMGRLPFKIESGFAGFTAEQFKNWCMYFSLFALKGTLRADHFQCWQYFCKACYLLCRREVTLTDVNKSDTLFEEFCRLFVSLYGKENCTMNLHLHCHLADCVRDYGTVYAFWLFAYERFNGILGSYHTNNRNISVQLMRRFLDNKQFSSDKWPHDFDYSFIAVLQQAKYQEGSLRQTTVEASLGKHECTPHPPVHECIWKSYELERLKEVVKKAFDVSDTDYVNIPMVTRRTKQIRLGDFILTCGNTHSRKSSLIFADREATSTHSVCLAKMIYFSQVTCQITSSHTDVSCERKVWVIAVKWYMDHPCRAWYGYPTEVWSSVQRTDIDFVPVSSFKSRAIYTEDTVNFGPLNGCIPVVIATPIEKLN